MQPLPAEMPKIKSGASVRRKRQKGQEGKSAGGGSTPRELRSGGVSLVSRAGAEPGEWTEMWARTVRWQVLAPGAPGSWGARCRRLPSLQKVWTERARPAPGGRLRRLAGAEVSRPPSQVPSSLRPSS